MDNYENKKNNRKGLGVSLIVHALVFLVAYNWACWRDPGPPYKRDEMGVMIDFGNTDLGSGEEQPEELQDDYTEEIPDEPIEDIVEEDVEPVEDVIEDEPAVTPTSDPTEATEKIEDDKPPVEKPAPKPKPKPRPVPQMDPGQGDDGVAGDEGKPQGLMDAPDNMEGDKLGGGDGNGTQGDGSFRLNGWKWTSDPDLSKIRPGTAKVKFVINEFGEPRNIFVEGSFTPTEKKKIKDEIMKMSFSKLNDGFIQGNEPVTAIINIRGK